MGRLKQMPARLTVMPARIVSPVPEGAPGSYARRVQEQPMRKAYGTARWQRLRWQVLVAGLFTCVRCKRVDADTSHLVADHVVPHRGDAALFWDAGNLQCLCKACHDSVKQVEERAMR